MTPCPLMHLESRDISATIKCIYYTTHANSIEFVLCVCVCVCVCAVCASRSVGVRVRGLHVTTSPPVSCHPSPRHSSVCVCVCVCELSPITTPPSGATELLATHASHAHTHTQ